jgi:hypothetical protein
MQAHEVAMFDDPRFTLSQVADAAGVSANTLRSWLQRKHWRLDMAIGDSPAEIAGKAHLVTLRRALHIGAAAELIRNDVDPARAFKAARSFVDVYDPIFEGDGHFRGPDGLFETGWTMLVAYPDQEHGVIVRIENDPMAKDQTSLLSLLFPKLYGTKRSGTFVWLNQVDKQIRTALTRLEAA